MSHKITRIKDFLNHPVSIAPLVLFRLSFGLIMLIEVIRFFQNSWIERYFINPQFYLPYPLFSWLHPLPGNGMYYLFVLLGICSVFIMLGLFYRFSALFFFLGFTYQFLLDQSNYLNHFYLIILLAFLLIFLPAHRYLSLDNLIFGQRGIRFVPFWSLFLLRFQIAIPYIYGGIAKINPDWLQGYPLKFWLGSRTDFPFIGSYFHEEWMVLVFSYGGLLFDLFIVPALLFSKTRIPAIFTLLFFHLTNHTLFQIGIFPWFMMLATFVFLPPAWSGFLFRIDQPHSGEQRRTKAGFISARGISILGFYMALQILLPLRHYLISSNPSWDEIGHRFAWHMKLRSKQGSFYYQVENLETGQRFWVEPNRFLSSRQLRKTSIRPRMILQFARKLAGHIRTRDDYPMKIRVYAMVSLNGRRYQFIIDPTVDLLGIQYPFFQRKDWIIPLTQHLPD